MKIFFYSSIEGRGFNLGFIDTDKIINNIENVIKLEVVTKSLLEQYDFYLINQCFYYDLIESAFGKIPNTEKYIYLKKGLDGKKENKKFYLRICFETEIKDEYLKIEQFFCNKKFKSNNEIQNEEKKIALYEELSKIVKIDLSDVDFGVSIDRGNLKSLIDEIEHTEVKDKDKNENINYIQIEAPKGIEAGLEEVLIGKEKIRRKIKDLEPKRGQDIEKKLNELKKQLKEKECLEIVPEAKENKYRLQKKNPSYPTPNIDNHIVSSPNNSDTSNDEVKDNKESSENRTKNVACDSSFKALRNEFLDKPANKIRSYLKKNPVVQEGIKGFINLIGKRSK